MEFITESEDLVNYLFPTQDVYLNSVLAYRGVHCGWAKSGVLMIGGKKRPL